MQRYSKRCALAIASLALASACIVSTESGSESEPEFDSEPAVSQNTSALLLTPAEEAAYRAKLTCMQRAAQATYRPPDTVNPPCAGYTYRTELSTDVMRVWTDINLNRMIVGFTGTRSTNAGDILRDVQSASFALNVSGIYSNVQFRGVNNGFWPRWANQAANNNSALKSELDTMVIRRVLAQVTGRVGRMDVDVVGHSLGAAVATLAAVDINAYLHRNNASQSRMFVTTYAFNSPHTGNEQWARQYWNLQNDRIHGGASPGPYFYAFTRSGDPVQSVPLFGGHHVFWNPSVPNATTNGANQPEGARNQNWNYCPHYNSPSSGRLFANHALREWETDLLDIRRESLNCMADGWQPRTAQDDAVTELPLPPVILYARGDSGNEFQWNVEVRQEIPQVRTASGQADDTTKDWRVEYNVFWRSDRGAPFFANSNNRTGGNFTVRFANGGQYGKTRDLGIQDGYWHDLPADDSGLEPRTVKSRISSFEYILDIRGGRDVAINGAVVAGGSLTDRRP
jgi:pimeloyl-ACP methyl ester carboxylesterase